ncbi:HD-GYP domain-containing protein [Methylomonas sp. LL1]|uniref:HD-GYP domain-containing protein n=1 Tax=Methylomonas sp. LL1 TaxID=2785785 RepID=UPI0018C3BE0D|nr:HD-GYP domain-containing protein [Methylomonas sp. LL1]QPK62486.1 HD-GYP domain-containing protein [Methylomonas sp. LL1]
MIKKVDVSDLRLGMYIHDLNRDWVEHPFLRNRFLVQSPRDLERVRELGARYVYIDTELGQDLPNPTPFRTVDRTLEDTLQDLGRTLKRTTPLVSVQEEIRQAKHVVKEANIMVHDILQDCRLGKQVELEKTQPLVTSITESIFRNPDALVSLLRIKQADKYTYQHSVAVGTLLISFCRALDIGRTEIELAGIGGLLHDIGKMKIPRYILNKPGKLSEREFALMQQHVAEGRLVLENTPGISPISINIAAEHHEHYDGSGYPLGLKGDEISRFGQMAAIVDVYDALTSQRVYHAGAEPTAVLKQLLECCGQHFDMPLVHSFIRTVGIYPVGALVKLENDDLAVVVEQHHEDLLHPKVKAIFNSRLRSFIRPRDYDLSKPSCHQRIVCFEIPSRWRIEPYAYL